MSSTIQPWPQAHYTQTGYAANPDIDSASSTPPQQQQYATDSRPSTSNLTTPKTTKRRRAITDAERKALRSYVADPSNGKPRHKELREWFEANYNHRLSQSTISECLSPKYAYLDAENVVRPTKKKNRQCQWPDLELRLFHWEQGMMLMGTKVTGEMLKKMASQFWGSMDQYAGQEPPKFSDGWVEGFRVRHPTKKRVDHGDALKAVKTLQLHARQQEYKDGQKSEADVLLRALHSYEKIVNGLVAQELQQEPSEESGT